MRSNARLAVLLVLAGACRALPPATDSLVTVDTDAGTDGATDGVVGDDADGDGSPDSADCDPADPTVFPGAPERCDGLDNDCQGGPHPEEVDGDGDGALDCASCDQAGYWSATRELQGAALVAKLNELSATFSCTSYYRATDFMFTKLDKRSDGNVECVYTGDLVAVGADKPDGTVMNTEHTWPQSLGAQYPPAECDLNHLFPAKSDANAARGNYPLDVVASVDSLWYDGAGSKLGDNAKGSRVFEPRAQHKGNAARALLYFAMRYEYDVSADDLARYQSWSKADPVDATELARTFAILDEQGAANPYVACPELVDRL